MNKPPNSNPLSIPPEREMPQGRLESRKAALVAAIESDLHRQPRPALRGLRNLRAWLMTLALFLVLAVAGGSSAPNMHLRVSGPQLVAASVGGSAFLVLAARANPRPGIRASWPTQLARTREGSA